MSQKIIEVIKNSPADRAGLVAGDIIEKIDGESVWDFIDYQALTVRARVSVETRRGIIDVKKGMYADMGLVFETPMMSGMKMCANRCVFCFVDQLPANARESLRVKDDDWRMSLMMGNYVTLTNVGANEINRIIKRHASPLYISVHATDPELRSGIMGQKKAADIMNQLKTLTEGGIKIHTQAVLCPYLNDGKQLERTIADLLSLGENILSLALVPVGLTGCREGLAELHKYTRDEARAVIETANKWREKCLAERGTRFVFPSDEFYLAADMPLPSDEEYEGYQQIDDGVGMLRLFETEFHDAWEDENEPSENTLECAIACGVSAADFLKNLLERYPVSGVSVKIHAIRNDFFGESVTVSGLVTGGDIYAQMKDLGYKKIFITETMLRREDDIFLDGMSRAELSEKLGAEIIPVGRGGDDLLHALTDARDRT